MSVSTTTRAVLLAGLAASPPAPAADAPPPPDLGAEMRAADAALFAAFNACDVAAFAALLSDDVEFLHDREGRLDKAGLVRSVSGGCAQRAKGEIPRVRRDLVAGADEAYPVPRHGAIHAGAHRFFELRVGGGDQPVGIAKFLHVWAKRDGRWLLSRVVSYDHRPAP